MLHILLRFAGGKKRIFRTNSHGNLPSASGFTSTTHERGYSASAPESSATEPAQSPCAWVRFVKFLNLHMKITYLNDKGQNECALVM